MITVLAAGAFTTIQDLGRPGYAHLGVSSAGAADALSLRIGNRLVGNSEGAAGLELTLAGGRFRFEARAVIALTGADFGPTLESISGAVRPLPAWTSVAVEAGEVLRLGATRSGARAYVCVAGGISAQPVLGSRSTHVASGLGGIDGGPIRAGQSLPVGTPHAPAARRSAEIAEFSARIFRRVLRYMPGPQAESFPAGARASFTATEWEVSESADRSGLRLLGPPLLPGAAGRARTEGVCAGSVQIPGDGRPIILFVDQQTTGGYPKLATVISADRASIGQLRPRQRIRFDEVDGRSARELLLEQERWLAAAVESA